MAPEFQPEAAMQDHPLALHEVGEHTRELGHTDLQPRAVEDVLGFGLDEAFAEGRVAVLCDRFLETTRRPVGGGQARDLALLQPGGVGELDCSSARKRPTTPSWVSSRRSTAWQPGRAAQCRRSPGDRRTGYVYLDQRGSLTKTAAFLNMHRNAVAYQINRIFELLDVDQSNPDDMLLLQLACRARELA